MSDESERRCSVFVFSLAVAAALVLVTTASAQTPELSRNIAPTRVRVPGLDVARLTEAQLNAVKIGAELRRLVGQLDAPAYDVREEAMGRLSSGACDLLHLCALLADPGLTAEQRHRLMLILFEQLLESPRGAVGIRVNPARHHMEGIVVQDLLPGLPAEQVLLVGDRLTRLNGELLETWDEFVIAVQHRPPGELVQFTIERPVRNENGDLVRDEAGQPARDTKQVELVLGSADLLIDPLTGRPSNGGAFMNELAAAAARATMKFGPRPQRIQIRGASPTRAPGALAPPGAVGGPVQ